MLRPCLVLAVRTLNSSPLAPSELSPSLTLDGYADDISPSSVNCAESNSSKVLDDLIQTIIP